MSGTFSRASFFSLSFLFLFPRTDHLQPDGVARRMPPRQDGRSLDRQVPQEERRPRHYETRLSKLNRASSIDEGRVGVVLRQLQAGVFCLFK
jgi:hypothetical protein